MVQALAFRLWMTELYKTATTKDAEFLIPSSVLEMIVYHVMKIALYIRPAKPYTRHRLVKITCQIRLWVLDQNQVSCHVLHALHE